MSNGGPSLRPMHEFVRLIMWSSRLLQNSVLQYMEALRSIRLTGLATSGPLRGQQQAGISRNTAVAWLSNCRISYIMGTLAAKLHLAYLTTNGSNWP